MVFEMAVLSGPLLRLGELAGGARRWVSGAVAGDLLGCWRTELGTLGRVLVLRAFDTPEHLLSERRRALLSDDPFNVGDAGGTLSMESFEGFPFLPPPRPGRRGAIYEFRTYHLKPGGLSPTLAGWQRAVGPAQEYTAHLVTNMFALDGAPRILHIWAFESLEQRAHLRATHYAAGLWPPPGAPEQIVVAESTIALPEPFSPLS